MPDATTQLIEYLARFAYKYSKEKPFLLASGAYSEEYRKRKSSRDARH
jgi:hypothetical protein